MSAPRRAASGQHWEARVSSATHMNKLRGNPTTARDSQRRSSHPDDEPSQAIIGKFADRPRQPLVAVATSHAVYIFANSRKRVPESCAQPRVLRGRPYFRPWPHVRAAALLLVASREPALGAARSRNASQVKPEPAGIRKPPSAATASWMRSPSPGQPAGARSVCVRVGAADLATT